WGEGRVVRGDLTRLPRRGAVQAVFSTAAFHWVLDHRRLFRGVFEALAPGGHLVAQFGGGPNLLVLRERIETLIADAAFAQFFADWSEPWYFADCEATAFRVHAAGFLDVQAWLEPAPVRLAGDHEYREFIERIVLAAWLERLPTPELHTAFLDALVAKARDDDPPFHLDYWRLNVTARR